MSENKITAKCECGNKVSVYISDHLSTIARPVDDKKHAALMGMGKCEKCGKDLWVFSYIEMHEAQCSMKLPPLKGSSSPDIASVGLK